MNTPQDREHLVARIEDLEQQCLLLTDQMIEVKKLLVGSKLEEHAFQRAIRRLGCELASQHGVSETQFFERFSGLCRWHYDVLLRTNSDTVPEVVSELDTRRLDDIPTEDTEPRVLE